MKEKKVPAIRFQGFTDEWEQRKVGNFYDFKNGLNKGKEFFGTGVPIVNFTDVFHHRGLVASQLYGRVSLTPEEVHNFLVKKGDIFFTRTSETIEEIGYPSVMLDTPKNTVFSGFVLRGRSIEDSDPLDDLFKKYVFFTKSFRSEMTKKSSMTTRALTSGTSIKKMLFQYPASKKEQHQIGLCITELDHLITLHQCKLTKLQLLKKSMLTKMFPKDGARVPEIRFQGFHDDWKLYPLNELAVFGGGHTPSMADEANYKKDGICWVTSQDVKTDYLFDTRTKLSDKGASELKLYPDGTIIMVTRSGILRHTLPIALLKIPATVNQDIRTISVGLSFSSTWLMQYLKVHERELLLNYGKVGTTVESIDFSKLKTMNLLVPTMDEQEKIGAYFSRMDNLIAIHQHNIAKLQHIKQAMLSKLFV